LFGLKLVVVRFIGATVSSVVSYATFNPKASACSSKPNGISKSSILQTKSSLMLPPT
jgi:hypothetical protein